jgi:hypothetical protein
MVGQFGAGDAGDHLGAAPQIRRLTDDLPPLFKLVRSDETKLEMLQADRLH